MRFFRRRTVFRSWRGLSGRLTLLHLLLLSGMLLLKLLRLLRVALFHRLSLGVVKVFLRGLLVFLRASISSSSPNEKNEFLNLVHSNEDMGKNYISEFTPPSRRGPMCGEFCTLPALF